MSPKTAEKAGSAETSRIIRREIRTEANARFLRRLPIFTAEPGVPEEMREMLARLDLAEHTHSD